MTSHLAHGMRRGLMGPGHVRSLEAALGKRAGALTAVEKGQARANVDADLLTGMRNKLINLDFDIWQRGTSFIVSNAGTYTADRWRASGSTFAGAAIAASRQAFAAGQTAVPGNPSHFMRFDRSVANGGIHWIGQRIEGVRTLSGRRATATFWAKGTVGKSVEVGIAQIFGTGGSAIRDTLLGTIALTSSWTKYTICAEIPSIASETIGSANDAIDLLFRFPAAVGVVQLDLAHVSFVEGDATAETDPSFPRHLAQELALCQRYFERIARTYYSVGFARVTTGIESVLTFARKRATPAVSASDASTFRIFRQGAGGFQYNAGTSLALGAGGLDAIRFGLGITDTTNIVAADAAIIVDAGAGASFVDIDAEL